MRQLWAATLRYPEWSAVIIYLEFAAVTRRDLLTAGRANAPNNKCEKVLCRGFGEAWLIGCALKPSVDDAVAAIAPHSNANRMAWAAMFERG